MNEGERRPGRALGLDVGERRIGVAVSDEMGWIASPVTTLDIDKGGREALLRIIQRYDPAVIVVGLPVTMRGTHGRQAEETKRFVESLRSEVRSPIVYWDERLTSLAAERLLTAAGMRRERRRRVVDAVAAALMLQSYLDAQRTGGVSGRDLEDDLRPAESE